MYEEWIMAKISSQDPREVFMLHVESSRWETVNPDAIFLDESRMVKFKMAGKKERWQCRQIEMLSKV